MNQSIHWWLFLLLLTALACRFGQEVTMLTPSPTPDDQSPFVLVTATPTMPPTVTMPDEITLLTTETATPVLAAPPTLTPTPAGLSPAPTSWQTLETWLADAWRRNVNPAAVRAALREAGWQESASDWRAADLDGDMRDEWLLTLYTLPGDPGFVEEVFGRSGDFWVVNGDDAVYRASDELDDPPLAAPVIVSVTDLTGDGLDDIVNQSTYCGAHTCYQNYRVLSAHHGPVTNVIEAEDGQPSLINISYSEAQTVDVDGDGTDDLRLHGGSIGSVGAGLHREYTEVWTWKGQALRLQGRVYDPSNLRFHWLYDGNAAFAIGDDERAIDYYINVVENDTLEDVEWVEPAADIRAATRQFAAFRLALLYVRAGRESEAMIWRDWLASEYPDAPLTTAADLLLSEYEARRDLFAACQAVTEALSAQPRPTGPLENMGYANPVLTVEDVCPLTRNRG